MEKFKINLLNQQVRNEAHLRNLERFTRDDRFREVSFAEQQLIKRQVEAMGALNEIYRQRLRLHGIEC